MRCKDCGKIMKRYHNVAVCENCGRTVRLNHNQNNRRTEDSRGGDNNHASFENFNFAPTITKIKKTSAAGDTIKWKFIIGTIITIVFVLLFAFALNKINKQAQEDALLGKISAGSNKDYIDKDYSAMIQRLNELGFTNITTIDLKNDSPYHRDETVESITIDGYQIFSKSDRFYPDAKIIIQYY